MFDQKDVEAYRRIKAPEELREQVMRLEQKPEPTRTRTKWISFGSLAAAACAAVLFIAALPPFAVRGETALLYQGVPIGAEPVSIPADHPQMTSGLREVSGGIPLALETGETTRVSVSGGEFSLFDPEGELLGDGTEAEISEDVLLYTGYLSCNNFGSIRYLFKLCCSFLCNHHALFHSTYRAFNQCCRFLCSLCTLICQNIHLICYYSKSSSGFSGSGCFNGCIQCK